MEADVVYWVFHHWCCHTGQDHDVDIRLKVDFVHVWNLPNHQPQGQDPQSNMNEMSEESPGNTHPIKMPFEHWLQNWDMLSLVLVGLISNMTFALGPEVFSVAFWIENSWELHIGWERSAFSFQVGGGFCPNWCGYMPFFVLLLLSWDNELF